MLNTRWGKSLSLSFLPRFYGRRAQRPEDLNPLRAELFSADQMEHFGKVLASEHSLSRARTRDRLLTRLVPPRLVRRRSGLGFSS